MGSSPNQQMATLGANQWHNSYTKSALTLLISLVLLPVAVIAMLMGLIANQLLGNGIQRQSITGHKGRTFDLKTFTIPAQSRWSFLNRTPWFLPVLSGHMRWIGAKPIPAGTYSPDDERALSVIRPGVYGPWWIRERTNIAVGNVLLADQEYAQEGGFTTDLKVAARLLIASLYGQNLRELSSSIDILGVPVRNITLKDTIDWIVEGGKTANCQQLVFVNPHCINISVANDSYKKAVLSANLVVADGIGMQMAGRLVGEQFRENVNGTDLFPLLCDAAQTYQQSIYLLGGKPGVAQDVVTWVRQRCPALQIAGWRDGYFSDEEESAVIDEINRSGASLLLVAFGVPRQDVWISKLRSRLKVGVAMGVGGLFDFYADRIPRAPLWMRETGLEWIYRLKQEFRRMWRRYLVGNFAFLWRVYRYQRTKKYASHDINPAHELIHQRDSSPDDVTVADDSYKKKTLASFESRLAVTSHAVVIASGGVTDSLCSKAGTLVELQRINGSSVLQHTIESLIRVGVTHFDILLSERPELIEDHFKSGEKWGVHFTYHLLRDADKPFRKIKALVKESTTHFWLVDCLQLPPMPWLSLGSALTFDTLNPGIHIKGDLQRMLTFETHHTPGDTSAEIIHNGVCRWALLPNGAAGQCPSMATMDEWLSWLSDYPEQTRVQLEGESLEFGTPTLRLRAQQLVMDSVYTLNCPGSEVESGVWLSRNIEIHPTARIVAPVFIDADVRVGKRSVIGPYASIGKGSVISEDVSINNSMVHSNTYIGTGLDFHQCVVRQRSLYHAAYETTIELRDDLLLNSVQLTQSKLLDGVLNKLLAISLFIVFMLPYVCLRVLLISRTHRQQYEYVKTPVRANATGHPLVYTKQLQVQGWPYATLKGWQYFFCVVYPGLWTVLKGQMQVIGLRARTQEEWVTMSPHWRELVGRTQTGLIHETFMEGGHSLTRSQQEAIERVYVANESIRYKASLLGRFFLQLFAPTETLFTADNFELDDMETADAVRPPR